MYEHSLKLWEILPEELDYDFLFSQRGCSTSPTPCRTCARASAG